MDLDKLIQNYEDIIEISKQTTADLEKTLALLKSQKLNQEKELSSNVTESIAYEDPRVQEQRDLALQNGYSKKLMKIEKKIGIFPAVWKILFTGIFIKLRTPN